MKEVVLLDSDIICYRCSASAEHDPLDVALHRIDDLVARIVHETNAMSYKCFLTGSDNFRYKIYPEYKANRKDVPKPRWLQECREHMVVTHKAKISEGNEADDEMAIEQTAEGLSTVIASIDKDLLQVPGYHFSWEISHRKKDGTLSTRPAVHQLISPFDALRNFYKQVITGDGGDGIPAFDGKFRNTVPQFVQKLIDPLQEMTEELEMYNYCASVYVEEGFPMEASGGYRVDTMHRNAKLLYLQRKENDIWTPPGQREESEASLSVYSVQEAGDGLQNTNA